MKLLQDLKKLFSKKTIISQQPVGKAYCWFTDRQTKKVTEVKPQKAA